eukprot:7214193-Pyramimonas_sp.AAC.1
MAGELAIDGEPSVSESADAEAAGDGLHAGWSFGCLVNVMGISALRDLCPCGAPCRRSVLNKPKIDAASSSCGRCCTALDTACTWCCCASALMPLWLPRLPMILTSASIIPEVMSAGWATGPSVPSYANANKAGDKADGL